MSSEDRINSRIFIQKHHSGLFLVIAIDHHNIHRIAGIFSHRSDAESVADIIKIERARSNA